MTSGLLVTSLLLVKVHNKDAMRVSFVQHCLHPTFYSYLSSESYSRKYEKLYKIIRAYKNITEKHFVEKV